MVFISNELHLVSTGRQSIQELAERAGGVKDTITCLHLREKTWTARELLEGIELLRKAGIDGKQIIVNDRVDVAAAACVKGVHLAYHSIPVHVVKRMFPSLTVGKSVHSIDEAVQAELEGADYVLFGHIFPTRSKPDVPSRGVEALAQVSASVSIPAIAIGGIQPVHVGDVLKAGARGVAVLSGVFEATDPQIAAEAYFNQLQME